MELTIAIYNYILGEIIFNFSEIRKKIRSFFIKKFLSLAFRLQKPDTDLEYKSRKQVLRDFFYKFMPMYNPDWDSIVVQEDVGSINYFYLSDGSFPKFDIILPQVPLFVVLGDIKSASWEEARSRGVTREEWELYNLNLSIIESEMPKMGTTDNSLIRLFVIRWNDPINHFDLASRLADVKLTKISSGETNDI